MQITLTKKLATAMGVEPVSAEPADPLFAWTAGWTNTFDRRKEDMVVMVNHATRFTVSIFGVKRNQFKNIAAKMDTAIRRTLLAMNINPEVVDEYMRQAGEIAFASNHDRKITAWVNTQSLRAALLVGHAQNKSMGGLTFDDTMGHIVSRSPVDYSKGHDKMYIPAEAMVKALAELTGKPAYHYRAFELLVTLDLEIYKATRRLIVPADIEFTQLHKLLQEVFGWENCHLHDFTVLDIENRREVVRLVAHEEDFEDFPNGYDNVLEAGHKLSEYFPQYSNILYTYDYGDDWEHVIEFVREIEEHNEESPYLLEAVGQTPPEDVGGVGGFIAFHEIMLNPDHPDYAEMKEWSRPWSPELWEWKTKPRVI